MKGSYGKPPARYARATAPTGVRTLAKALTTRKAGKLTGKLAKPASRNTARFAGRMGRDASEADGRGARKKVIRGIRNGSYGI